MSPHFGDIVQSRHPFGGAQQEVIMVLGPGDDSHLFSGLIIKESHGRDGYQYGHIRTDWLRGHDWEHLHEVR